MSAPSKTLFVSLLFLIAANVMAAATCEKTGLWLQVLGSGGPELDDGRASSGYLLWQDGKARLLIDIGSGSMANFANSGAALEDLDAILLSHLHVDHSADLPALLKGSYFGNRDRDLFVYGPTGNDLMPATTEFVGTLFGPAGAYRYLQGYLKDNEAYRLTAIDIDAAGTTEQQVNSTDNYRLTAVPVNHGPLPALGWRVDIDERRIVFSGDMSNANGTLAELATDADILVAHNAVPEEATGVARKLHMPPSVIGQIAQQAAVKQLVLSHRMQRTLGREDESTRHIRKHYAGPLTYANDLQCFRL
jgi:ribonuclease BN (tRNA processing enzyme)